MVLPDNFPSPYLAALAGVFWLPLLVFRQRFFAGLTPGPVLKSAMAVTVIGWAWSGFLSFMGWWSFPGSWIVDPVHLKYLPFEEAVFYPTAMLFIIGLYNGLHRLRPGVLRGPFVYRAVLVSCTTAFALLAGWHRQQRPYYLLSQLLVFNALAIGLSGFVWKFLNPFAMFATTLLLAGIGFVWDFFAFRYNWWVYNAIIGLHIVNVPIEDFNFFLCAAPAGLSIYLYFVQGAASHPGRGRASPGGRARRIPRIPAPVFRA